ncbi:hypothetical protein FGG08_000638 [Glutinoglossum americanum]|uniref:Uncharacterized protein n=1 Tax=Glutinoglossum americanum TaxID=1670608 RepID=A0A9P8L5Z9_9PEZI|nr:hypothetical protein FGG08_000638 [Glutinoglossum americanum]
MHLLNLLAGSDDEPTKSIAEKIHGQLDGLDSKQKRLIEVLRILDAAGEVDEQTLEAVNATWGYLITNRLWESQYQSLESLKDEIDYEQTVKVFLEKHELLTSRKQADARKIQICWGQPPHKALPDRIRPPKFSQNLLQQLLRLSKICPLNEAVVLLQSEIDRRILKAGCSGRDRSKPYVLRGDVLSVLHLLKQRLPNHDNQAQSQPSETATLPCDNRPDGVPIDFMVAVRQASIQNGTATDKTDGAGKEDDEGGDEDEDGAEDIHSGDDEDEEEDEDDDIGNGDNEDEEEDGDEVGDMHKGNDKDKEGDEDIESDKSGEETVTKVPTPSSCRCSPTIINGIQDVKGNIDDIKGLRLLAEAIQTGLLNVCHLHLRMLAKTTVGLQNNMSGCKLRKRLQDAWRKRNHLDYLRRRNPHWFLKTQRPEIGADRLVVYRYHPIPPNIFRFDEIRVFERFAGRGSWGTWERDGTIIIPKLFRFLSRLDIRQKIDVEFDLYRHHHRSLPGRSRLGWLRNMFYSIIQQTVRQDPVWYAMNAAARPDKNWRLISYPYITKDTDPGENTGFLHLDLNTTQYVKDGSGGNLLSSSIALDDEQADGCTIGVPGFHHHIRDWHKRLIDRGEDTAGFTTNCSAAYRVQDRKDWGEPIPMPCPALGLRLTRPEIIHGSTPRSYRRRRSLFAWYTGIDDTHTSLDMKGTLSWNDLAACHRDLEAPSREPSGQAPRYGLPGFRFPGSVITRSSSAIGDVLVGRRKWTDPQAMRERDILLGSDDAAARSYVDCIREEMIKRYEEAFEQLKIVETEAFGENSYFRQKELGLPMESNDYSDEIEVSEDAEDGDEDLSMSGLSSEDEL